MTLIPSRPLPAEPREEPLRHLELPMFDESAERRAVLELGQALQDAWNRGDAAGYASLFTDDADFVAWNGSHGRGRQAIEDGHRRLFDGPLAG